MYLYAAILTLTGLDMLSTFRHVLQRGQVLWPTVRRFITRWPFWRGFYCKTIEVAPIGSKIAKYSLVVQIPIQQKNIKYSDRAQRAHDVYTTSVQRRCNVMTLHRHWGDVVLTSCACWELLLLAVYPFTLNVVTDDFCLRCYWHFNSFRLHKDILMQFLLNISVLSIP